ncbi:hypothetical protein O3G_MSEX000194, partial [Manduca sexta]
DETVAAHRRTVINEWKREMGAPFIEMVGFEKIHQKQKFDRLLEVCVHDQNVAKAGDVASLCPNVRSLDVSCNLFSNWREVIQLSAQLPDLRELDVRIQKIPSPGVTLRSLTILRLDGNPIDSWREVMNLGQLRNLQTLSLNECLIEEIRFNDKPGGQKVDVFENLEVLFLSRNRIND